MKRKTLFILIAIIAVIALIICAVLLTGGKHRIRVISGERNVDKCPRSAKPGELVTVTTVVVADGEVYVNGVDGKFVRPGEFQFEMPDRDVELKVTVIAYPDGA